MGVGLVVEAMKVSEKVTVMGVGLVVEAMGVGEEVTVMGAGLVVEAMGVGQEMTLELLGWEGGLGEKVDFGWDVMEAR